MNATKTMSDVRYEAYSEVLEAGARTLSVCAEVGDIIVKTHKLPRVDVEARLREVDLRVWQEDGCIYVQATNESPEDGSRPAQRKADILISAPADCSLFVQVVCGAVAVHDFEADARTHVISGKTTLDNLAGSVNATVVTGSINYAGRLANGTHRFVATTGSLRLALQEVPNARVYAWATTGRVHCDLALSEQRRGGYLTGDHVYGIAGAGEGRILAEVVTGSVHLGTVGPAV